MADSSFSPEIQRRIDALPEDVRKLVYSADMNTIIQEIGRKNALHIDQLEALEAEAAALMIGITEPDEFTENLSDVLNLDQQRSAVVAKDVEAMLFGKIRESMKQVYEERQKGVAPAPSAPAAVSMPATVIAPIGMEKSVIMPSAQAAKPTPPLSVQITKPVPPIPTATAPAPAQNLTPKPSVVPPMPPAKAPDMHPAEVMMSEKTIQVAKPATPAAKPEPPKPQPYKADPYREPVE